MVTPTAISISCYRGPIESKNSKPWPRNSAYHRVPASRGSRSTAGTIEFTTGTGIAVWRNGNTSQETTLQKANEAELDALETKLDKFYGPYLQLSNTNRLIATELKSRQPDPDKMRILLIMLKWKEGFSKGDIAQINEIVSIDESL
jgi:hypothetical protein